MAKQKKPKTTELGVAGIKHSNGYLFEEFLPELTGTRGKQKIREMSENEATIGALLTAVTATIRPIEWKVEAAPADTTDKYKTIMLNNLHGMDFSFDEWLAEALTMVPFGFSVFEKVYKVGDDGNFALKRLAPRPQETIEKWDIARNGDIKGFYQIDPNTFESMYIPMERCILLRTTSVKNNPEGKSILRNCYKSYTYLNNIQLIEAIAIERELAGVPIIRVPSEMLTNDAQASVLAKYTKIARDLKMGEQGGVVIPSDPWFDEEGKPTQMYQVSIELIASQGKRLIDTDTTIKRYQGDIARSLLADFLMLGQNDRGSFSMSKNKTDLFLNTLQTFTKEFARGIKQVRDELWEINGFPDEMKPEIIPGQINPTDLTALGDYIYKLSQSGLIFLDDETQKMLRRVADLPESVPAEGALEPGNMELHPNFKPEPPPAPASTPKPKAK